MSKYLNMCFCDFTFDIRIPIVCCRFSMYGVCGIILAIVHGFIVSSILSLDYEVLPPRHGQEYGGDQGDLHLLRNCACQEQGGQFIPTLLFFLCFLMKQKVSNNTYNASQALH